MKKILQLRLLFTALVIAGCSSPDEDPRPVENEDVFINELYAAGDDWIELYNSSASLKDISGYFIYDNADAKYKLPAGTTIAANGFLILNCNDLATGLNTNFKLTSTGETVYLENASGTLIDRVDFPELKGGQSYGRYPDGSPNLKISGNSTKGFTNGESGAPVITNVNRNPLVPGLNQAVTVTVDATNTAEIAGVKLYYRFNSGSYTIVNMTLVASTYSGVIPAQSTTGTMEYYIEAKGLNNKLSYRPTGAPDTDVYFYLLNDDVLPQLYINEFMAFNTTCCPDNDGGTAEYDDWIEIYNPGSEPVDIGGMYLSDDLANPFMDRLPTDSPSETTIPAGGFIILWADNTPSQGPGHLNFGLSSTGEAIGLYYIDGRTIDTKTYAAQSENKSFGRKPDGTNSWVEFNTPTPGQPNQ